MEKAKVGIYVAVIVVVLAVVVIGFYSFNSGDSTSDERKNNVVPSGGQALGENTQGAGDDEDDAEDDDESEVEEDEGDIDPSTVEGIISEDRAREIALREISGEIVEIELELDDGIYVWEVEILNSEDGLVWEVEINAETEEVLQVEID
jgi:uncharacterized membrane protein YkoI